MSKIIFYPESDFIKEIIPPPQKIEVPEWFKKIPVYDGNAKSLIVENISTNHTIKACTPFLDSLTSGYCFYTWADIQIKIVDGYQVATWTHKYPELNELVSRPSPGIPSYDGFEPFNYSWISHWGIKTPPGYSAIFTHPFNRSDLPFITSTGIMDTDKWGIWGNQPVSLKSGWEGTIPAGTPIIQIIPIKRESWHSEIDESLTKWANKEVIKKSGIFRSYYKNNYWTRKEYK